MKIKRQIPNIITAGNLFFGCLAVFFALTGHLSWAPWCIFISAFLDFFDGFAARKLGVSGELGKQLDSLADMVTFGVAPGIIVVILINLSLTTNLKEKADFVHHLSSNNTEEQTLKDNYLKDAPDLLVLNSLYNHSRAMHFNKGLELEGNNQKETPPWMAYLPFIGLLIPVFSMMRLAKFNLDTRKTDGFFGLATPANTLVYAGLPLILTSYFASPDISDWQESIALFLLDYRTLIFLSVSLSLMMVSDIPMFSLKIKHFGWKGNEIRYVFLAISIILIVVLLHWSIPFIMLTYILMSLINLAFRSKEFVDS